jgi:hypothetical protein
MVALSSRIEDVISPPLAPADEPIDLIHLARMTLGERSLEREVLALFDRQAVLLLRRMGGASRAMAAAAAHTLKGSALGIGAWNVARAAEAVENADEPKFATAVGALSVAIDEARTAIAGLLQTQ